MLPKTFEAPIPNGTIFPTHTYLGTYGCAAFSNLQLLQILTFFGNNDLYQIEWKSNKLPPFTSSDKSPSNCVQIIISNKLPQISNCLDIRVSSTWDIVTMNIRQIPNGCLSIDQSSLTLLVDALPNPDYVTSKTLDDLFCRWIDGNSKAPIPMKLFLRSYFETSEEDPTYLQNLTLAQLINQLPGWTQVEFFQGDGNDPSFAYAFKLPIEDSGELKAICSLMICYPFAREIIMSGKLQFLELDCSFRPTSPYCYCVVHGGYYNHTYTFALIIYPTECQEMYLKIIHFILEKVFDISYETDDQFMNYLQQSASSNLFNAYQELEQITQTSLENMKAIIDNYLEINQHLVDYKTAGDNSQAYASAADALARAILSDPATSQIPTLTNSVQSLLKLSCLGKIAYDFIMLPILSDLGTGLRGAFAYNPRHVFCHVHILRDFGTNANDLIYLIRLLCASKSEALFRVEAPKIKADIDALVSLYKDAGNPFGPKYADLIKMCQGLATDTMRFSQWAIFMRIPFHVPRCSNQCESLHSHINRYLREHFHFSHNLESRLIHGLLSILHIIRAHLTNLLDQYEYNRGTRAKFYQLQQKHAAIPVEQRVQSCNCGREAYYLSIYGITLHCQHENVGNGEWTRIESSIPAPIPFQYNDSHISVEYTEDTHSVKPPKQIHLKKQSSPLAFWKKLKKNPFWQNQSSQRLLTFLGAIKNISIHENVEPAILIAPALSVLPFFQLPDFPSLAERNAFRLSVQKTLMDFINANPQLKMPTPSQNKGKKSVRPISLHSAALSVKPVDDDGFDIRPYQ